jgi:hypothetical protein
MGLNRLQNNMLFANNVMVSSLLQVPLSWSSIALMDLLVFHPVRVGTFDTLNWLATFYPACKSTLVGCSGMTSICSVRK